MVDRTKNDTIDVLMLNKLTCKGDFYASTMLLV